jgi:hypothetical protein
MRTGETSSKVLTELEDNRELRLDISAILSAATGRKKFKSPEFVVCAE